MKIATLRDSTPGPLALKLHSNRDALGGKNDSFNANCNSHMLGGAAKIKRLPHDKAVAIRDILSRCDPDINASLQQTSTSPTSSQPQAASVPYVWKTTHRAHNKKYHAEHGNGSSTKLITKLTVEGLPSLRKNAEDPATFIEFQIDFKGWAMMNGAFQYTVGPPPAVPADAAAAATRLAKLAEGARYVCQSIADPDLRATVAAGAGNPPTGPAAFRALQEQFLQGTAEQPAIVAILDGMRLRRDQSVVAFRSRFTKMAAALDPAPADRILSQKFSKAITADTGDTYTNCVVALIANPAAQDDFSDYAGQLTRLCTQQKLLVEPTVAAMKSATANNATTTDDDEKGSLSYTKSLEDKISELERKLDQLTRSDDNDISDQDRSRYKRPCYKCGELHNPNTCSATPECDFTFGNGEVCGGCHLRRFCWHEDPTRCKDPKLRKLAERRIEAKSVSSTVESHMTDVVDFNAF